MANSKIQKRLTMLNEVVDRIDKSQVVEMPLRTREDRVKGLRAIAAHLLSKSALTDAILGDVIPLMVGAYLCGRDSGHKEAAPAVSLADAIVTHWGPVSPDQVKEMINRLRGPIMKDMREDQAKRQESEDWKGLVLELFGPVSREELVEVVKRLTNESYGKNPATLATADDYPYSGVESI